jgi:hypothetical protein
MTPLPCHPKNKLLTPENALMQLHFCRLAGFSVWIFAYAYLCMSFIYRGLHFGFVE